MYLGVIATFEACGLFRARISLRTSLHKHLRLLFADYLVPPERECLDVFHQADAKSTLRQDNPTIKTTAEEGLG